jgi:hypothetical protein
MAFVSTPQCDHGVEQAWTPIYLGAKLTSPRSCGNECANLKQPFGPIPSQWAKGNCQS